MEHILLIEDNLSDIALIQSLLRDAALTHRLYKAKSLQEGLDIIRHNLVEIVLLDLSVDDSAGFNTLRMFLQEVPNIPVVVLTGTSSEVLGMQIVRAGAQDYLVKGTFDGKQLVRSIRYAIRRFKAQVALREELWEAQRREKYHQFLYELVQLGSWQLDLLDNTMHWSNEMYTMLGFHPNSFEPKLSDYLRLVYREDQEKVKTFFQDAMRLSDPMKIEHRVIINNRMVQYLCLKAQVVSDELSGRVMLVGSLQDITEFKTALSNGHSTTTTVDRQMKASFQLRHLLGQLLQALKNLELGSPPKHRESVSTAKNITRRLLEIIHEQLNAHLVKMHLIPVQQEQMQLSAWQNTVQTMLEINALHLNALPKIEWADPMPEQIIADEHLVSLLLFNLMQHFAGLNEVKEILHLQISVKEQGTQLCIAVQAPELLRSSSQWREETERLKQLVQHPFNGVSKPEAAMPTRLIAISKIIQALRAELVISKNDAVNLIVPVAKIENENGKPNRPIKMLIVEHQTIVQIALKRILQAGLPQISLDFAENLAKGVQHLAENEYDVVLADVQLPATEPTALITALKETKNVAVMALASDFSKQDKRDLSKLGVGVFVTKPPQREALIKGVQQLL